MENLEEELKMRRNLERNWLKRRQRGEGEIVN